MSNPYVVTDQIVDDIVCTAMEGGCNYWTREARVIGGFPEGARYASEVLTRGRSLRWVASDDYEETVYTLTLPKMKRGIRKAAAHYGQTVEAFYEDHDATAADVAVQFALLGEIVYG